MEMKDDNLKKLYQLKDGYREIRECGYATKVTIATMVGNFEITNKSVMDKVLDLLIHEAQEQINSELRR